MPDGDRIRPTAAGQFRDSAQDPGWILVPRRAGLGRRRRLPPDVRHGRGHRAVQRPAVHDPSVHPAGDLRHVHRQRGQQRPGAQRRRPAGRRGDPRPAERVRVPAERPGTQHRRGELPGPGVQLAQRRRGPFGWRCLLHRPELPARQPRRPDEWAYQRLPRLRRPGVTGGRPAAPTQRHRALAGRDRAVRGCLLREQDLQVRRPARRQHRRSQRLRELHRWPGRRDDRLRGQRVLGVGLGLPGARLLPAGTQLGTIRAGTSGTTNVAFGGPDRQTLYVTSGPRNDSGLYSVRLNIPGYPY